MHVRTCVRDFKGYIRILVQDKVPYNTSTKKTQPATSHNIQIRYKNT